MKHFEFYKISFDEDGNIIKTRIGKFQDISQLMSESDTTAYDLLQFFLNHMCDLKVLNDLSERYLHKCVTRK